LNIGDIQNALIGVLTDSNGHIKGVIQLFNRIDPNINVNTTPQITGRRQGGSGIDYTSSWRNYQNC
jgi:hypothetical protein